MAFWVKWDSFDNGKLNEEAIDRYFDILKDPREKYKKSQDRKMNAFIYQFSCKAEFMEDEQIGELYYIENGEAYFDENDILRRELFEEGKDLFI